MKSLAITLILALTFPGQAPPQRGEAQIRISSAEVVLDIIARDKKGRPVSDLTVEDFEVLEDGVKQPIESFRLVTRGAAGEAEKLAGGQPAAPRGPALTVKGGDPEVGVSVVALVFDRLSTDARKRALEAAMTYVANDTALSSYVGVFAINLSLNPVQNFTTDPALVKKGVEKAGTLASASFDSSQTRSGMGENVASRAAVTGGAGAPPPAAGAGPGASSVAGAMAGVDRQFEAMQARAQETFEVLQRDQQGYATTNGLLAIVNSMQRLPGRKAVIFFSEGMALPPNVQQHFRSVINAANRAQVSVYAVDAAGLRAESTLKETRDEINARSRQRMDNLDRTLQSTDGPLTKGLERNEDLLTLNPQSGLSQLALQTGGAFIGDTNQLGPRLRQVDEELGTYYLLTYAPTNQSYDGKFRNIAVKVKRGGVDIQTRKGYYAVTPPGSTPLFYYEALPLAALGRPARPKDFPLTAGGLSFPEAGRLGRTAVEVEVPAAAFTFAPDGEKKVYGTDFSILVLVKDQSRQVVDKLSHHYVLVGPLNSLDAARKGKVLFYRETDLAPGSYQVEAVAYDALSQKASVNQFPLEIPEADEGRLRLSSVAIIGRAEQVKEPSDSPFLVGGQLLVYPNLGEPIRKSASKQLGFYFNVYPAKGAADAPQLTLEVWQGDKSLAKVPLKLSAPDARGRIQYASALPLESLGPGSYELKISVGDSRGVVSRSAPFTLEP